MTVKTSNGKHIYCPRCQSPLRILVAKIPKYAPDSTLYMGNCHGCGSAVQIIIQANTHWKDSITEII